MTRGRTAWWVLVICGCSSPVSPLVTLTDEVAGLNCPAGGLKMEVGPDDDGDGQLDPDEVEQTSYVCDGVSSLQTLVLITEEAAGENCTHGGNRIDYGLDDNGNGFLDLEEIDGTAYVCDGLDNTCKEDLDCGGALLSCDPTLLQCRSAITLYSQGTPDWPDQACGPALTFGECDTNDAALADDWATAVCVRNGWVRGTWTGQKAAGCGNGAETGQESFAMSCAESLPCEPVYEYLCDTADQTIVELTCSR
jgi:hypothetical protein